MARNRAFVQKLFLGLLTLNLAGETAFAQDRRTLEQGLEMYAVRPSIASVAPSEKDLSKGAQKLLYGLVNFIIEMRAFYPDSVIYVLARDGEPIFDLWQTLFPEDFDIKRIKLVNISRISDDSENFESYMGSIGMFEDADQGRHMVALDSGYEGSIVNSINAVLKPRGAKLYAHLMSSSHREIPSSRVSTRPFLASAKRKKHIEDDDFVSEAASLAVEQLENIAHYTGTAVEYFYDGENWHPVSVVTEASEKRKALEFMAGLKRYALDPERREHIESTQRLIQQVMRLIRAEESASDEKVAQLVRELKRAELQDVWADLREAIGKGTIAIYDPVRTHQVLELVPSQFKALDDIDDEEGLDLVEQRERELVALAGNHSANSRDDFWVADIIRLYLDGRRASEIRARQAIFDDFQENKDEFPGGIGEKLGEGVRSDVFELGSSRIIKVAYEVEDMTAIEGEALVFDFLSANQERYPLRLLPILERGEKGIYLVKPRIERETIGKYILRKNGTLTEAQTRSLEDVYNIARRLAEDTGLSLDIKSDNLFWTERGWAILDLGPRTMSHPYFFTLERRSFAEYLGIWNSDSGSRSGVMDVEDYIRQSRRECEEAVLLGYRELKAEE